MQVNGEDAVNANAGQEISDDFSSNRYTSGTYATILTCIAEDCAGQSVSSPCGVLKSAMQRLEQGDVVTATQLARLTRHLSRFMCAGIFRHLPETRMI